MSHGRHTRPRARGGFLETVLALALAAGAVVVAVAQPGTDGLALAVIGIAVAASLGLLLSARATRQSVRAIVRSEERLRVLEARNREEGADLHRRVLESITREGELRYAVEVLAMEIGRLRASVDGIVAPIGASLTLAAARAAEPASDATAGGDATAASVIDIPLVQRVLTAQETLREPVAPPPGAAAASVGGGVGRSVLASPVPVTSSRPAAMDTWAPPARPEPVSPAAAGTRDDEVVRAWVVRELQLEGEPGAALTMRILDLTSPATSGTQGTPGQQPPTGTEPAAAEPATAAVGGDVHDVWAPPSRYRRPA